MIQQWTSKTGSKSHQRVAETGYDEVGDQITDRVSNCKDGEAHYDVGHVGEHTDEFEHVDQFVCYLGDECDCGYKPNNTEKQLDKVGLFLCPNKVVIDTKHWEGSNCEEN
ncbi:hypothetical protein OGAPHI_006763 [Ogataea philodendri]|uniref:Uncharacterized protein n=1 Tax=Ogataea philodendri TaxID=1378263 RepID=A0A9P8T167_9ASCO|nr:uncharacterized protein OGAPHI_006763 [Ogataea philodendri]KAH3661356.1 hypothetical protein OGAPHI_006763 [Ogataea philodendri]